MNRPNCAEVAELLQRFIDSQYLGECVSGDVLDQAQAAVHELLAPITTDELVEVAALGSYVGEQALRKLGEVNAASN